MSSKIPVLFDTDVGSDIDDAVALLYLLAEPRCELVGISSVSGQPRDRARLADAICRAAGRKDIPVWSGTGTPLLRQQQQPECPQARILTDWQHRHEFPSHEAIWQMREIIRNRPGEIVLLTVGPLTNVGLLFALDPEIPSLLNRLVVMGGSFWRGDECEWNVKCDPHAAARVFRPRISSAAVHGYNVTKQCTLDATECRKRFSGGALDIVAEMAEVWFQEREQITFHDPLAACSIFEPDLCDYTRGNVEVEYDRSGPLGHTRCEEDPAGKHNVAHSVDAAQFFDHYFRRVSTL